MSADLEGLETLQGLYDEFQSVRSNPPAPFEAFLAEHGVENTAFTDEEWFEWGRRNGMSTTDVRDFLEGLGEWFPAE